MLAKLSWSPVMAAPVSCAPCCAPCSAPLALARRPRSLRSPTLTGKVRATRGTYESGEAPMGGPGQCTPAIVASMTSKIKQELETSDVDVQPSADASCVAITVVSELFEGKDDIKRQRLVYKAIWEEMSTTLHAVDELHLRTPTERDSLQ